MQMCLFVGSNINIYIYSTCNNCFCLWLITLHLLSLVAGPGFFSRYPLLTCYNSLPGLIHASSQLCFLSTSKRGDENTKHFHLIKMHRKSTPDGQPCYACQMSEFPSTTPTQLHVHTIIVMLCTLLQIHTNMHV